MENVLSKEIQITNLSQIQAGKYTIGKVSGNDGKTYDTFDMDWYILRRVGETLTIQYYVKTKAGTQGRMYENNVIVTDDNKSSQQNTQIPPAPSAPAASNTEVLEALRTTYTRIELMEKNILARFDFIGPVDVKNPSEESPGKDTPPPAAEEVTYVPAEETKEDKKDAPPDGLPF